MNIVYPDLLTPSGLCRVFGCEDDAVGRGLCGKHYQRWRVHGDPEATGNPIGKHLEPWDGKCVGCGRNDVKFYAGRTCVECQKPTRAGWEKDHAEERRKYGREYAAQSHRRNRATVLAHYGGKCVCCNETEEVFLAIDHKHGEGNKHRRSLSPNGDRMVGTPRFYRWLIASGFPTDFQILCHNCNYAKSRGGCPHQHQNGDTYAFAMA